MKIKKILLSSVTYLLALLMLFPLYWMIAGSFMRDTDITKIPPTLLPERLTFNNYIELFNSSPTIRWFLNSVYVSGMTTFLFVIISSMAGYSFAKKNFFGRNAIFLILIMTMMIPKQVLIVPLFKIIQSFNMFDTLNAMVIPTLGWPMGVFLMRQYMLTLPSEIIESAKIDGCSEIGIFVRIMLPLAKPAIGALAIFTFVRSWNDYIWQLLVVSSKLLKTLPLGIATLQEEFSARYGLLLTGATMAAIPMILVFLVFQRYFTKGLTVGAVKG